MDNSVGRVHCH
jgi:hypothetical protein